MDDEAARERFGMIPLRAAREAGLAGCDYRVLIVIASHANERGFAWPSLKTIASLARTTEAMSSNLLLFVPTTGKHVLAPKRQER
jgi:hypothetical protein